MPIDIAFFREFPRYAWRFLRIVYSDILSGRNPVRFYIRTYRLYCKHGLNGVVSRINQEYFQLRRTASEAVDYALWLAEHEIVETGCLASGPFVSIVLIDQGGDDRMLEASLVSIVEQSYTRWEYCVIEGSAFERTVHAVIEKKMGSTVSVRTIRKIGTEDRDPAIEDVLSQCQGEWIIMLGSEALLRRDALCQIIKTAKAYTEAGLIYSDEDRIDIHAKRSFPLFKPDWSPDLLRSMNYISQLCAFRRDLLQTAGVGQSFSRMDGGYGLLLRVTAVLQDDQIKHIPMVLYHKQIALKGFLTLGGEYADVWESGRLALQSYLDVVLPGSQVGRGDVKQTYRIRYPLKEAPKVSLIIPTRDGYDLLHRCINSIFTQTHYPDYEIIIVDNQSSEWRTLDYLRKLSQRENIRVIRYDAPFNFSAINNLAVRFAQGEVLGFINNDVEIINKGWLDEMVSHAIRPEIGAVGAKLYFDNDTIQHAGVIVNDSRIAGHAHKSYPREDTGYFSRLRVVQNYSAVTAACMVVHKALFEAVGGFDEENLAIAFNDVDLCLKLEKQGYRNLWTPFAEAYHHESITRGLKDTPEKLARFEAEAIYMQKKWAGRLEYDPYYNVNLNKDQGDFSLGEFQ